MIARRCCLVAVLLSACSPPSQPPATRRGDDTDVGSSARRRPIASAAPPTASAVVAVPAALTATGLDPATTHAVIAGVLSWQDPKLTTFNAEHRKDQELHDVLVQERAVPAGQLALLLDRQATHDATLAALERAARAAPPSGTLVFYYAGHGVRDEAGGVYLASWDIAVSKLPGTGLSMSEIEGAIAKGPKGLRVILMADCCFSGGLREVAERLSKSGMPAVSLTSADVSNTSTQNWTFTQAAIDALRGDSLSDRDADGSVELGELHREVDDAMKFREKQRAGYARHGVDEGFVLARTAQGPKFDAPSSGFRLGEYARLARATGAKTARVRSSVGTDRLRVRLYHYSDIEDLDVARSELTPITFGRHPKGANLTVKWDNRLWEARVVETDDDFHFITYPGWPPIWDEWILSDRIEGTWKPGATPPAPVPSFSVGAQVEVEWGNKWWKAKVKARDKTRYLIAYDGYDASWDEWVGPSRVRPR